MKRSSLIGLLSGVVLCTLGVVAQAAQVSLVNVQFVDKGSSVPYHGIWAGYYDAKIDGILDQVMCDDVTRLIYPGNTWKARELTFADMQSGASGKFANTVKYSEVGWLFSQTPSATRSVRAQIQAAIWTIMSPNAGVPLDPLAQQYFTQATSGLYDSYDWSHVMTVLTPSPFPSGQEFLRQAAPVPEPSAFLLFGSGLMVITMAGVIKKRSTMNIT